jgi:glucose/arabinose dehydrogenase
MIPAVSQTSRFVLACVAVTTLACGGSSNPPTQPPPGSGGGGGTTITGRERIGWTQQAENSAQLATFDFAAYVDGSTRRVLENDTCTGSGPTFECSAPLPSLTAGQHTIELVAFMSSGGSVLESDRSAPLTVTVAGVTAPPQEELAANSSLATSDGHRFAADIVARGLDDPTDLAVAPDGRVFVIERAGRVRILGADGLADESALELDDVLASGDAGLTSLALHPDFANNGQVYLAYISEGRDGEVLRLARFRERNGILAQGAVVARERTSSAQFVTARFGADGRLYAGIAAGVTTDPRAVQAQTSVLGKILRFNDDGTTPRDNPRTSLAFTSGHRDVRALAWDSASDSMWELERNRESGDELNRISAGAHYGWPVVKDTIREASVPAALVFPVGTDVAGASFIPMKAQSPLAGELLVASRGAEDLLRIRVGRSGESSGLIEGVLQGRYGRISAVTVAPDGTIFFATGNRDTWGAGQDLIVRISAVTQ